MRLLDADILIDLLRRHPPAVAWFRAQTEWPSVAGFVIMEVIQGCRNRAEVRAVQTLVRPLPVVWPSEADCDRALADFTTCYLSHRLGLLDALIPPARQAVRRRYARSTRNTTGSSPVW